MFKLCSKTVGGNIACGAFHLLLSSLFGRIPDAPSPLAADAIWNSSLLGYAVLQNSDLFVFLREVANSEHFQ